MTTLAGVHLNLPRYDRRRVDGLWMSHDEIDAVMNRLRGMSYAERSQNSCIGPDRADLVLAGCAILEGIRRCFPSERIRIADRGLREGMLLELMRADRSSRSEYARACSFRAFAVTGEARARGAGNGEDDKGAAGGSGGRELKTRVKTARKRTLSSTLWLQRQLNDPYVARAKREGWRSRAAFKLLEIDEKHHLLQPGQRIIDLGAAPGGWSQAAAKKVKSAHGNGKVVGIDLLDIEPIAGVDFAVQDFLAPEAPERLKAMLGGEADGVISDMAANTTGHKATDHLRIVDLAELAAEFAGEVLKPGGYLPVQIVSGRRDGQTGGAAEARLRARPPYQAEREPRRFGGTLRACDGFPRFSAGAKRKARSLRPGPIGKIP